MFGRSGENQPAHQDTQLKPWLVNRAQRRKNRNPKAQNRAEIISKFNFTYKKIDETMSAWTNTIQEQDMNLTKIVYQGKPFITEWLELRRQLPKYLESFRVANQEYNFVKSEVLNNINVQNIFPQRIRVRRFGFFPVDAPSLFDIENMPLLRSENGFALSKQDTKLINLIYHEDIFNKNDSFKSMLRETMFYLATQDNVRPEERINIPDTLRPLHTRLKAYFDYYKNLITNTKLDEWSETSLLRSLIWTRPFLPQVLGCYIAGSLEIMPQSAIKLFQTHAQLTSLLPILWEKGPLKSLERGAKDAYRVNGLPKDLANFQHLDFENDLVASDLIETYYKSLGLSKADLEDLNKIKTECLNKLAEIYFKPIKQDIENYPKKRVQIELNNHPLFSEILLTSQYQNTLIFIIKFRNGNTTLTLEIDKKKDNYGLPPKLLKNIPHVADLVLKDLLQPLLIWGREHHPSAEPIKLLDYKNVNQVGVYKLEDEKTEYNPDDYPEYRQKRQQSAGLFSPITKFLEGPEPADSIIQMDSPKFVVFHSRDQIQEGLGKNASDRDIDVVMKTISEFEYGRGDFKKLREDSVEGEGLWEIRVKGAGSRVLVNHLDGNFFTLARVGYRREIFNIRRR